MPLEKLDGADVYVHADTFVVSGVGTILIVAVGKDTMTGKIKESLMEKEDEETPLQIKLNVMAELIGYVGMAAAGLTLIAIVIREVLFGLLLFLVLFLLFRRGHRACLLERQRPNRRIVLAGGFQVLALVLLVRSH